jgi:nitrile hydratase
MSNDHDRGDHNHDAHAPPADIPESYAEHLTTAVLELLVEKGILTADEVQREIEVIERRTPAIGARVVARAWTDRAFYERLMNDGTAAVAELGISMGNTDVRLSVIENTPAEHNVVVCTLCSCYPRALLGLPPAWYKSYAYRSRVVREPRAVLREFGVEIEPVRAVRVHDSTANSRFLVIPLRPPGTETWDEARLAGIVTRDSMVGVGLVAAP